MVRSLDDIFIEFVEKWAFLWGGQTGEKGVGKYDVETDIRQAIDDAYEIGFSNGHDEGYALAQDRALDLI